MNILRQGFLYGLSLGFCISNAFAYERSQSASLSGGNSTSVTYSIDATIGDIGSFSTSDVYTEKSGYVGQLYDLQGIGVSSTNQVSEEDTIQLIVRERYDDDTLGSALSGTPEWHILTGPVASVNSQGLAYTSAVFEDQVAGVMALYNSMTGHVAFTVLNTVDDNFGLYAGDGANDGWQVSYFGEENPNGIGSADPDGDGYNNKSEWITFTVPTNKVSVFKIVDIKNTDQLKIYFPTAVGRIYWLEKSTNLTSQSWIDLSSLGVVTGTGKTLSLVAPTNTASANFRVRVAIP